MKNIPIDLHKISSFLKDKSRRIFTLLAFVGNSLFQKWAMVVLLSLILPLLLMPHLPFNHPVYTLDMIAASDLKADRNFLVEDRHSTEQKRMDALSKFKAIYDYESDLHSHIGANLIKAFLAMEGSSLRTENEIASQDKTVSSAQGSSFPPRTDFEKYMGVPITIEEYQTLRHYKYSPAVAHKLSELISGIMSDEWITNITFTKQDLEKGIIVRDVRTRNEFTKNDLSSIRHLNDIDIFLLKKVNQLFRGEDANLRRVAASLVKKLIQPNLTFNRDLTEQRKQQLLTSINPVYFQVQKNEMIVREGEKINPANLEKLEAFYEIGEEQHFSNILIFFGMFMTILFLATLLYLISVSWLRKSRNVNMEILFISVISILQVILVKSGIIISEAIHRAFPFITVDASVFAIPFAAGAMLVGIMINRNTAFIFSVFSSVLISFLFEVKTTMTFFSFLGSMTACYHIVNCRKRSAFFKAGFFLGLVNVVVIIALTLLAGRMASLDTLIKTAMGFFGGILSGVIVAGVAPLVEFLFKYTTDIKLLELANLNQPIFQRMIIESPGTYHHSIIVASMVEAAAEAIGANSLLAKVSAYYHDIGKVKKPHYYIENQRNGENRHDKLSPRMSAMVIVSHVKDGCELAGEAKLGADIINIIREHHGTSLVRFFYDKAKKDKDPSVRSLPESDFRYPGPKPQTREAGLVLLGDVIEASCRTLNNPTPSRIRNLVRERIELVFTDGQLDECELTLRDLNSIYKTFTRILNGIFHQRIDYPMPNVRDFKTHSLHTYENSHRKPAEKSKT